MKTFFSLSVSYMMWFLLGVVSAQDEGFTEPQVILYGTVEQVFPGTSELLQIGVLEMTFTNTVDATNTVVFTTALTPTGVSDPKPFSYRIEVPLKYLPGTDENETFLSVAQTGGAFNLSEITVDGQATTLADGSTEFFTLSMVARGDEIRLDLLVALPAVDSDGDGLPDNWEAVYNFSNTLDNADQDPDGDGATNLEEYQSGTNPLVDNRIPTLTTTELKICEKGEIAVYLNFASLGNASSHINIELGLSSLDELAEVYFDGSLITDTSTPLLFTHEDLERGALTIRQITPWETVDLEMKVTHVSSDTVVFDGVLPFVTELPSQTDGTDAVVWYDASVLDFANGLTDELRDRSGHEHHAIQPTPSHQPTLSQSSNGLTQVAFTGESHLFIPEPIFQSEELTTVVALDEIQKPGIYGERFLWSSNDAAFSIAATQASVSVPNAYSLRYPAGAADSLSPATDEIITTYTSADEAGIRTASSGAYSRSDSDLESPMIPTLGIRRVWTEVTINRVNTDHSLNARFEELLIFHQVLPEQRLRKVQNYLQSKWKEAIIWDQGESLSSVTLNANPEQGYPLIIQGGWADDSLSGSNGNDLISGGGGDDELTGGEGRDIFLFTSLDTGNDCITDFNLEEDQLDFSNLYGGLQGDALDYIQAEQKIDYTKVPPQQDTVLTLTTRDDSQFTVTLKGVLLGNTTPSLRSAVMNGSINMGALSIPQSVTLDVSDVETDIIEGQTCAEGLTLTRIEPLDGELIVPFALTENSADGAEFYLSGESVLQSHGNRAYLRFAPGESSLTFDICAIEDGIPEGLETWEFLIPESTRYSVSTGSALLTLNVEDHCEVFSLEVVESDILFNETQAGEFKVTRSAIDPSQPISVTLSVESGPTTIGDLEDGIIDVIPRTVEFAAGEVEKVITISAQSTPLENSTIKIEIVPGADYGSVAPAQVCLNLSQNQASLDAKPSYYNSVTRLSQTPEEYKKNRSRYIYGVEDEESLAVAKQCFIDIESDRVQLFAYANTSASDVQWSIEAGNDLDGWTDVTANFALDSTTADSVIKCFTSNADPSDTTTTLDHLEQDRYFYRISNSVLQDTQQEFLLTSPISVKAVGSEWALNTEGNVVITPTSSSESSTVFSISGEATTSFSLEVSDTSAEVEVYVDGVLYGSSDGSASLPVSLETPHGMVQALEFRSSGDSSFSLTQFSSQ